MLRIRRVLGASSWWRWRLLSRRPGAAQPPRHEPRSTPTPRSSLDFQKRVDEYVALHRKLEGTLPKLPKQTTPQQIDTHQRALGAAHPGARKGAKQGDIFTPAMQRSSATLLAPIFSGPDGAADQERDPGRGIQGEREARGQRPLPGRGADLDHAAAGAGRAAEAARGTRIPLHPEQPDPVRLHAHIIVDYMDRAFD